MKIRTEPVLLVVLVCFTFGAVSCFVPPRPPPPRRPLPPPPIVRVIPPPVVVAPAPVPPPPLPHAVRGPVALFADIRIEMPRPEVEAILGRPIAAEVERNGMVEVWYMTPPPITKPNLPKDALGSICVIYRGGRVVEKRLNPQL